MIKFLKNLFKKKKELTAEEYLNNPQMRREVFTKDEAEYIINPMWEISVKRGNELWIKMPFCFLIHAYLKEHDFDPDLFLKDSPMIHLQTSPEGTASFPLYKKNKKD